MTVLPQIHARQRLLCVSPPIAYAGGGCSVEYVMENDLQKRVEMFLAAAPIRALRSVVVGAEESTVALTGTVNTFSEKLREADGPGVRQARGRRFVRGQFA